MLAQSAGLWPQRTAIVKREERVTYGELDLLVHRMAHLLRARGIAAGDRVALSALNGVEFVVAYYAVLRAGAVVVPLNILLGTALLAQRLEDSGAKMLICVLGPNGLPAADTAQAATARIKGCQLLLIDPAKEPLQRLLQGQPDTAMEAAAAGPDADAVVTYPKRKPGRVNGVVLSHAALMRSAESVLQTLYAAPSEGTTPDAQPEVHLVALPLFHMVGQTFQLGAGLATGAKLVMKPRFDADVALDLMAREGVTSFIATPGMLWALATAAKDHPDKAPAAAKTLRLLSSQLGPLPPSVREAVTSTLGVAPLEGFGVSETCMVALHARPGDQAPGSVGTPMEGFEVRLVDADDHLIDGAGEGNLEVRGAGLMRAYDHNPEATQAALHDGWFRTGYYGRRAADGRYELINRPAYIVMRHGVAIHRRIVEEALLSHPAITSAKIVTSPTARSGEEAVTLIERDPKAVISEDELVQWAFEQLPGLAGTEIKLSGMAKVPDAAGRPQSAMARLWPGFLYAAVGTAIAFLIHQFVPVLSPLTAGVLLGVVLANIGLVRPRVMPGLSLSTKKLLRLGVVFLGLQLSLLDVLGLGWRVIALVIALVILGFLITRWLGKRLGLSDDLSLLTATGFSICGASAIAAMQGVKDADEDDVAISIALVTIFGTIAMFGWPFLQGLLHLGNEAYGAWAGASVHEVAQVVAAASPAGEESLATAIVVKLARVLMLAPMIAMITYAARRRSQTGMGGSGKRPPLLPLFVLGFLIMVGIRTSAVLPQDILDIAKVLTTIMLAAALFGLGVGVRIRVLMATGPRALVLGACSTVVIAVLAYVGVVIAIGLG